MTLQTKSQEPRLSKRRAILDSAYAIVRLRGVDALTLEAVAREAEVSKGGLLYHFPNKDALIGGLIAQAAGDFDASLTAHLGAATDAPGGWLQAFINASFDDDPGDSNANMGLLAAAAINPSLLDPIRTRYAEWQARTESAGIDPTVATIIRLAVDGLTFADLFGLAPPPGLARDRLREALLTMASKETHDHPHSSIVPPDE